MKNLVIMAGFNTISHSGLLFSATLYIND